ncbi:MAG: type II secretion system F family protein [Candidatus Altiarchaeota archaeon]|nr:type II secretion system F family protein [Candidatus Altiarchaeota archaeon]
MRLSLIEIDNDSDADEYIALSILSALIYGILLFILIFGLLFSLGEVIDRVIFLALMAGFVVFALFFFLFLIYPSILAGKKAEQIERDLIFALKDILLEINSGSTIYSALIEVANSEYGMVSKEIENVVRKVDTGTPLEDALEKLALKTTSENFKNAIWQLVNTLRAGSDIEDALRELIRNMNIDHRAKIRNYAQELNVMVLIYLLFAVVIPTIAITMLIIIGPFISMSLGLDIIFYLILSVSFVIQIMLIEFMKSRRPVVNL